MRYRLDRLIYWAQDQMAKPKVRRELRADRETAMLEEWASLDV